MGDKRRVHDETRQAARDVVVVFAGCLREEERIDAFREVYGLFKARLGAFPSDGTESDERPAKGSPTRRTR